MIDKTLYVEEKIREWQERDATRRAEIDGVKKVPRQKLRRVRVLLARGLIYSGSSIASLGRGGIAAGHALIRESD